MNRRELLTRVGLGASAGLAGARTHQGTRWQVKPIRIKNVETFNIEIPATPTEVEAGVTNRTAGVRVRHGNLASVVILSAPGGGGLRGAAVTGFPVVREALVGAEPVRDGATPQTRLD